MDINQTGIDLAKVRIIQNYLTKLFHDLYIGRDCLTFFVFSGDTHSGQLKFNREYLDTFILVGRSNNFWKPWSYRRFWQIQACELT